MGEVGVTEEEFAMACEEGMARRDINRTVLDQILAVDDFLTFKVRAWKLERTHTGGTGRLHTFACGGCTLRSM